MRATSALSGGLLTCQPVQRNKSLQHVWIAANGSLKEMVAGQGCAPSWKIMAYLTSLLLYHHDDSPALTSSHHNDGSAIGFVC